jgi:hypothetical protein
VRALLLLVAGEEGNQVLSVGFLLQSCEDHLGAWNHLFRVDQVLVQSASFPSDARVSVGISVDIARNLSRLASDQAKEVGSLQVLAALVVSVALGALLDENFFFPLLRTFSLSLSKHLKKAIFCDARKM